MNKLVQSLKNPAPRVPVNTMTLTENDALTNATSNSEVLDFFSLGGALRNRQPNEVIELFSHAFNEDKLLALKALFYLRDIRGGQGERKTFRTCLEWLAQNHPDVIKKNLQNIPLYGRYDDLFSLLDSSLEEEVVSFVKKQFNKDLESERPSLLGKWLPSVSTSSYKTRKLAGKFVKLLNLTPRNYRKALSSLRKKIDIVENKMCSNSWKEIDYSKVPSRASLNYRCAFLRRDTARYGAWQESVKKGESKVNTQALYPYDVLRAARDEYNETVLLQWQNLPNYLEKNPHNGLVVCDVSGSMESCGKNNVKPIDVSLSLALYYAERNQGVFKNHFITFSENPKLQEISGKNLYKKIEHLCRSSWGMNTNLKKVFKVVLDRAVRNSVSQDDMPAVIYVVSDMEFDEACKTNSRTNFQVIQDMYAQAGYTLPKLVFWNVNSKSNNLPVRKDESGVLLVSGCSPSIFEFVLQGNNPYQFMMEILNKERYSPITV